MSAFSRRLALLDYIAGFAPFESALDRSQASRAVESQRIRAAQSEKSLWLILITGAVYLFGLWDEVARMNLAVWVGSIIALAIIRVLVCHRIVARLEQAGVSELYRNEITLFFTSLLSCLAVGSGVWWIGLDANLRSGFALILLTLIYAIGTTTNSSFHSRGFPFLLVANLGQVLMFLLFFLQSPEFEGAVAVAAIMFLLTEFARRNAEVFAESIRIRDENLAQNAKLEKDKLIIEKALNLARKANEEKNRFMAAASHDLRQPLHAMTLFLGSLRHLSTDPRMIELVDKIDETSTILHEQFNSLLDLSKFDAGVVAADVTEFRLDIMLKNIADAAKQEAEQKNLAIHLYVAPVTVRSDMLLMERMLRNLVVNAVRYTEKGAISIQTRRLRHGLVVSVIDTGVGIELADQERIFQDYYQISNPSRSKGKGSGLGLAIVKRIASLLDLTVSLKSERGVGSNFSVLIPLRAIVEESPRSVSTESVIRPDHSRLQNRDVLVVDDDESILDALTVLLQTWGCHTTRATSSEQVDRLMSSGGRFDLVLLDDMLDNQLSGLDIALRLADIMPRERIIMATGNANSTRLGQIRDAGFNVLVKPVDAKDLLEALVDGLNDPSG
ncbi:hypothetical protein PS2015_426 [Pseudohongiella spirulinae]|uniref:histidine kinase n=1 Tax=Pseudohongiella spirulinae TaxID=1249552 RepID=A0A0S2KA24_9GAMM|nr:hybrid sensor histidine kinase/response regulator [Pseudohongiella spirulinae]ALO45112.1 hypothetical protein PS2015_426 [Pseudohongiella spirulinae]